MSLKDQTTLRVVLYEGNGAQPLEAGDRFAAMTSLLEKGFAVTRVAAGGRVAPADHASLLVLGRFNQGRAPQAEDTDGQVNLRFQDISGFEANRVGETVEAVRADTTAAKYADWKSCFTGPVYDSSINRMQWRSFCLFGIFGVDEATN